jgi:parvulin-like peptidyl-prolyl isomerase
MFVQGLYFELQQGGDFAELARRYSAGPGAAEGGELGWFERGQMVDTLEKVAFRLPAGSIGMPIRSPAGYQLLKVEDREGSIQLPFDAVADEIRQQLYLRETEERYDDWLRNGLRKGHHVEVLW